MINTIWLHPFNGIAGDMTLGALINAGVDVDQLRTDLKKLDVDGWVLHAETISRNGIGATNVTVETDEGHSHRTAGDIIALVEAAELPERATRRAVAVFTALAEAEGEIHQADPTTVHFHEVGGIDAIIDVVGTCLCLEALEIDQIVIAPVAMGQGIARSAHGKIPNPAPATIKLLEGVPVKGLDVTVELTTPTGAAIVRALADSFGPMPDMSITTSGFGAGDNELAEHPNLLHVVIGEGGERVGEQLIVLEANIDDLSGEYMAHTVTQLMDAGALDAWITPIEMKHGRPAGMVSALVEPLSIDAVGKVLLSESGSLGYRAHGVERTFLDRRIEVVDFEGHEIRVKVTENTAKAEFADVVKGAAALGRPARQVAADVEAVWTQSQGLGSVRD